MLQKFILLVGIFSVFATSGSARVLEGFSPSICSDIPAHIVDDADAGNAHAQFVVGLSLLDGLCGWEAELIDEGMQRLEKAARAHHPMAAAKLAILHDQGLLTPRDQRAAIQYYEMAALHGHMPSQSRLGLLLVSSAATIDQQEQGFFWLGAAADQGDSHAAATIGLIYARGLHGIEKDDCRALDWYSASELLDDAMPLDTLRSEIPITSVRTC